MVTVWVVILGDNQNNCKNYKGAFSTKEIAQEFVNVYINGRFEHNPYPWEEEVVGERWKCREYVTIQILQEELDYPDIDCWRNKQSENIKG